MRRLLVSLMVAGSLLAVSVAPAAAITKTYVKDDVHTFVGLIGFYDTAGDWSHRCTGELLSPTVVLTAGHCTDNEAGGVMASARIWFQQDAGVNYDLVTQRDAVTGYPDSCTGTGGDQLGKLCATSTRMFNYGFDNFAGFPNTHDVGIVILDQPINGFGFATLAAPVGPRPSIAANTANRRHTWNRCFMNPNPARGRKSHRCWTKPWRNWPKPTATPWCCAFTSSGRWRKWAGFSA